MLREARAAAQLYHPHIVPVYDAGTVEDTFFIASAFVDGETLAALLDERPLGFPEAATFVSRLATALDYAHSRGIIRRDVKPGNIMVRTNGDPALMDSGLARFLESDDRLTHDGAVLGTPAYMSPEQARGEHETVGPASDQYSLGVVLYQLLCHEIPFTGPPAVVLSDIVDREPPPPRAVRADVPRDLETICLKSMATNPAERYPSCQFLANDLGRWLRGEPIAARPTGLAGRAWRWCKRQPVVAGLSMALGLTLLAGAFVSLLFGVQATRNAHELTIAAADLTREKAESDAQRKQVVEARDLADKEKRRAEFERDRAEANFYINQIAFARQQADQGSMAFTERLLDACPENLRHFEWGYLKRLCHLESMAMRDRSGPYGHVAVSPDGKYIASGARDDTVFKGVVLWDSQTGEPALEIPLEADGLSDIAFSPKGPQLAAVLRGDESARVWDAVSGEEALRVGGGGSEGASCAAFAPDGKHIAIGGQSGTVWLHDLASKKESRRIATGNGLVQSIQFSPIGAVLASEGQWICQLWDAKGGHAFRTICKDPQRYGSKLGAKDSRLWRSGRVGHHPIQFLYPARWPKPAVPAVPHIRSHAHHTPGGKREPKRI